MRRIIFTALVAIVVALAGSGDALAKAGSTSKSSGGSFGSKGSRTHDAPMERTLTPPPAGAPRPSNVPPPPPQAAPRPGNVDAQPLAPGASRPGLQAPAPVAQPGFFQRNPFMAGLAGGLIGTGIGSLLFGHSPALASGAEASPVGSMLGLLLQLALVGGLIWLAVRMFRGGSRAEQANPFAAPAHGHVEPSMMPAAPRVEKEFEPAAVDQQDFTDILLGVQNAWSEGNLAALRRFATPEVVSWLSEDLSRNASEGLVNKVENVSLLKGDISGSWSEGGFDYVTAVLTFQCIDVMVRADTGAVVKGNPSVPVSHTEAWTFMRAAGGSGRWLLSAVEQV